MVDSRITLFAASLFLAIGVLLTSGCAGPQPKPERVEPPEPAPPVSTIPQGPKAPPLELTEEVLYKLLVAEFAGQRERLDLAVNNYLDLARRIPDPQLAARAARVAVYAKQDDKALEAADLWVKNEPDNLEARQMLSALLIRKGRAEDAYRHLDFMLNADKESAGQNLRVIAGFLSREANKTAALDVMERLMADRRDDPDALFAYAFLAMQAGKTAEAKTALTRAMALAPQNSDIAMAYLGVLQQEGDKQAALRWLEDVLRKQPDEFEIRLVYARLLAESKQYDKARAEFDRLAKAQPDNPDVEFALGLIHVQRNELDKARPIFERLVEKESHAVAASYYLGQIAESEKDYRAAWEWYSSIPRGEIYLEAQLSMAVLLLKQEKPDEARAHLHRIKTSTPEEALRVVRVEGEILTQEKRYEEALKLYDQALGDRYDSELLYTRAMLAERMGRLDILERDLRRILAKEPNNAQAMNALGFTLADRTDRFQEAYGLIKRALELNPNDYYTLDSMGWVLYRLGRLEEAETHLRRAQAVRADPEIAAHLGEVLWSKGDQKGAREVWESALKTTPGDKKILDAMKRLTQ
jgi:tetratricopeptide (TPR) repeat protein